jgi:hypothetical protein
LQLVTPSLVLYLVCRSLCQGDLECLEYTKQVAGSQVSRQIGVFQVQLLRVVVIC